MKKTNPSRLVKILVPLAVLLLSGFAIGRRGYLLKWRGCPDDGGYGDVTLYTVVTDSSADRLKT